MLTLETVKLHLRVDHDFEDEIIDLYINAAYGRAKYFLGGDIPEPEPAAVQSAVLLYITNLYENRNEAGASNQYLHNSAAEALLMPYRKGMGA